MPRKQWVVVKTERTEDDDLIVVSGEEGGEDEEDEDEREMELVRERGNFNISNIRSLSAELAGRAESDMDSQVSRYQSPVPAALIRNYSQQFTFRQITNRIRILLDRST